MSAYTFKKVRIELDLANSASATTQLTGKTPEIWRGNDVKFEFAVYDAESIVDISAITSIVLEVKPLPTITDTAILSKTVTSGFTTTLTDAQWQDGSGRHFEVAMTASETGGITVDSTDYKTDYHVVVRALCSSTTTVFTLGVFTLTVMEDGH